jgi:hypothetical protein
MVLKFNKQRWLTKVAEVLQNFKKKLHYSHIKVRRISGTGLVIGHLLY